MQRGVWSLSFNFDGMKPTNTFDAHRLAKFAKKDSREGKGDCGKISSFCIFY